MTEKMSERVSVQEMSVRLAHEFMALRKDKELYAEYIDGQYWTPHDGITMHFLKSIAEDLDEDNKVMGAIPYIEISGNRINIVVNSKVDKKRLQVMAELLVFIQASPERMDTYRPLYELLKAAVLYIKELLNNKSRVSASVNVKEVAAASEELDFVVDESMLPVLCAQYIFDPDIREKLTVLVNRGADFDLYSPASFASWIGKDDEFVYAKKHIRQDLDEMKKTVCNAVRERLQRGFVLDKSPAEPEESTEIVQREILRTLARIQTEMANDAVKAKRIDAVPIMDVDGTHHLKEKK